MFGSKPLIVIIITLWFSIVYTEDCDMCKTRKVTDRISTEISECVCDHGFFCDKYSDSCERCPQTYFWHEKDFNVSKGTTRNTLKTLLERYHVVNVHHLVDKLHKLAAALIHEDRKLDETITHDLKQIDSIFYLNEMSKRNFEIVREKLKFLQVKTNLTNVKKLLDDMETVQKKYKHPLPKIDNWFLGNDFDFNGKTSLLTEVVDNLRTDLPTQDWFSFHDTSTFYLDEIYSKTHEPNSSCNLKYDVLVSRNRNEIQKLRDAISEIVLLLFPKPVSIEYKQLLHYLDELRGSFNKTTDLANVIIRKKHQFDEDIASIYQLFEMATKMKQLLDTMNTVKQKMSTLSDQIESTRPVVTNLEKRLAKLKGYDNEFTNKFEIANELLKKIMSLRNVEIADLDVSKLEKSNLCLERKLDSYIECIKKILKIDKLLDTGCRKLQTLCSLNIDCEA